MNGIKFQFVETNGIRLHAATAGPEEGPLIVLLHGFPEFWYGWHHQIQPLAEKGYFVVAPDQRGYNLSDKPQNIEAYRLDNLRDDIIGLIRHFGREKAIIAGHDWGGAVAWHLAASRPEYTEKLLIVNIPHPNVMPAVMLSHPQQLIKSSYIGFFQLPVLPETLFKAGHHRALKQAMRQMSLPDTFTETDFEEYEKAWSQPGALTAMLNWYRAIRKGSLDQVPKQKIQVPVRIIWGIGDQALSSPLAPKSLNMCEDGEGVFIGDATHWVLHEQPELASRFILSFLEREKPAAL